MKERPILFSDAMVRAILEGRKTQTRRVIKPQPTPEARGAGVVLSSSDDNGIWHWLDCEDLLEAGIVGDEFRCPHGVPGDLLWVRETWRPVFAQHNDGDPIEIDYRATMPEGHRLQDFLGLPPRWKPSIHMRREHSRLTLRLTDVRVERVQDISAKDILAEGVVTGACDDQFGHNPVSAFDGKVYLDLISLWAAGWNSLNAERGFGWGANPWVWVLGFQAIQEATT